LDVKTVGSLYEVVCPVVKRRKAGGAVYKQWKAQLMRLAIPPGESLSQDNV
jgi:hypothetical protein